MLSGKSFPKRLASFFVFLAKNNCSFFLSVETILQQVSSHITLTAIRLTDKDIVVGDILLALYVALNTSFWKHCFHAADR